MNNSEIHEIKKRLKFCDEASFKIETCYVIGSEKRIRSKMNSYLTNIDDSERHKYIEILKKGLSGVLNRNLLNLSFERSMDGEDAQKFLLSLRDSELNDQSVTDKYYEKIINAYSTVGNYLIITIYDAYDVPREGTDGFSQGESEEVFRYIFSCSVEIPKSSHSLLALYLSITVATAKSSAPICLASSFAAIY